MVSIHNNHKFHNYITSLPVTSPKVNPNTILSYIQDNYPNIFDQIKDHTLIHNKLNNPTFQFTLFLPTSDFDYKHLLNNVFKGVLMIDDDDEYMIVSQGATPIIVKDSTMNGIEISVGNIKVGNGIIHIL